MVVKVETSLEPRAVTEVTIATATRPAIRPYSNAVTPRLSWASALRLFRNLNIVISLLLSRRGSATSSREVGLVPEHSAGRLTDASPERLRPKVWRGFSGGCRVSHAALHTS